MLQLHHIQDNSSKTLQLRHYLWQYKGSSSTPSLWRRRFWGQRLWPSWAVCCNTEKEICISKNLYQQVTLAICILSSHYINQILFLDCYTYSVLCPHLLLSYRYSPTISAPSIHPSIFYCLILFRVTWWAADNSSPLTTMSQCGLITGQV